MKDNRFYNIAFLEREIRELRVVCRENPDDYESLEQLHQYESDLYNACSKMNLNYTSLSMAL